MTPKLFQLDLPPLILVRGFWLYAWKIIGPDGKRFAYVGMCGDVSGVAQSPYPRRERMLTKEQEAIQQEADDLCREIINAMRSWVDKRGSGEMPAAVPLVALGQALVHVLEMVTTEKRRLYADDFIRSLNQYLRKGAS